MPLFGRGKKIRLSKKLEDRIEILESFGFDPSHVKGWSRKWIDLKRNAVLRDSSCELSFQEYMYLAKEAGLSSPSQVGRTIGSYQLGRLGDVGTYRIGNCRFILREQNLQEMKENGGVSEGARKRTGRTKETHAGLRSASEKLKGRTKETDPGYAASSLKRTGKTKEVCAGRKAQSEKISKSFVIFDPSGQRYEESNLKEFCLKHNLNYPRMVKVCRGQREKFKGWIGKYKD